VLPGLIGETLEELSKPANFGERAIGLGISIACFEGGEVGKTPGFAFVGGQL